MTTPHRLVHPPHVQRTLERLAPDRPSTAWDAKVERLLNGLRSPHLYIGRALADGAPWLLDRTLLWSHAHVMGGTRSGKTSLCVAPLGFQLTAHADSSLVYIDLKGRASAYSFRQDFQAFQHPVRSKSRGFRGFKIAKA